MGTRSLTIVREDGADILTLYRQFDGYPTGHGAALADFMAGRVIVNGIPCGESRAKLARMSNGAGCFAAGLVSALKGRDVGNVYVYPVGSRDCGEEYTYILDFKRGDGPGIPGPASLVVTVTQPGPGPALFAGDAAGFVAWIRKAQRREAEAFRARAKSEGWTPTPPAVTAVDTLADVADAVARGGDVSAVLQRFTGGPVTRDMVRAIRVGVTDSRELARVVADMRRRARV